MANAALVAAAHIAHLCQWRIRTCLRIWVPAQTAVGGLALNVASACCLARKHLVRNQRLEFKRVLGDFCSLAQIAVATTSDVFRLEVFAKTQRLKGQWRQRFAQHLPSSAKVLALKTK